MEISTVDTELLSPKIVVMVVGRCIDTNSFPPASTSYVYVLPPFGITISRALLFTTIFPDELTEALANATLGVVLLELLILFPTSIENKVL